MKRGGKKYILLLISREYTHNNGERKISVFMDYRETVNNLDNLAMYAAMLGHMESERKIHRGERESDQYAQSKIELNFK